MWKVRRCPEIIYRPGRSEDAPAEKAAAGTRGRRQGVLDGADRRAFMSLGGLFTSHFRGNYNQEIVPIFLYSWLWYTQIMKCRGTSAYLRYQ